MRFTACPLLLLVLSSFPARNADAAWLFTLQQVGPDVVLTGSGTIDLTGSSFFGSASVSMGAGTGSARPTQDVGSLNRDYQDRRGGYNSYQQRSSTRSSDMSRGMGARPRRR